MKKYFVVFLLISFSLSGCVTYKKYLPTKETKWNPKVVAQKPFVCIDTSMYVCGMYNSEKNQKKTYNDALRKSLRKTGAFSRVAIGNDDAADIKILCYVHGDMWDNNELKYDTVMPYLFTCGILPFFEGFDYEITLSVENKGRIYTSTAFLLRKYGVSIYLWILAPFVNPLTAHPEEATFNSLLLDLHRQGAFSGYLQPEQVVPAK